MPSPMLNRTKRPTEHQFILKSEYPDEKIQSIKLVVEGSSIQLWIELNNPGNSEFMQYLSPIEAVAFGKAFERAAVQALKEMA